MQMKTVVLAIAIAGSLIGQPSSSYRVSQRYALGGGGSWDYIVPDPPHHRLFIARQNRVMVVDQQWQAAWRDNRHSGRARNRGCRKFRTRFRHFGQ